MNIFRCMATAAAALALGLVVPACTPATPAGGAPTAQPAADTPAGPAADEFLAQRAATAAALAEPVAACIVRQDTQHAVFRGCIDWHSAAHAAWALAAYTRMTGDRQYADLLNTLLDPAGLDAERRLLREDPEFETPYGRAWFLRLVIDYTEAFDDDRLVAFGDEVGAGLFALYSLQAPDPHSGAYASASWALINLLDYAEWRKDEASAGAIRQLVRRAFVEGDPACPAEEENDFSEFMAICTNWAWLASKVMPEAEFRPWLAKFMPDPSAFIPVTKPEKAHQNGRNFSRAWGLWNLYRATGDERFRDAYLAHFDAAYSRPETWKGDYYAVGHWVAQFGMFALRQTYADLP